MTLLVAAAWLLVAAILVAAAYRLAFALAWLLGGGRPQPTSRDAELRRFRVVIPAHDEELMIEGLLASIREADYPADRIEVQVVADNCRDATAARARAAGARVAERSDPANPGKGQALAWFFAEADLGGADAVALFDADNRVHPDFFRAMNRELAAGGRVLQGYYGIANPDASTFTRMIAVTYVMKNLLFYGGKRRLGRSVILMGTGMVFDADVIRAHGWRAQSIGEDLEQTFNLLEHGERIDFVPDACIEAAESTDLGQGYAQRQRWSSGRRALFGRARHSIREGLARGRPAAVDCGVELLMPTYAGLANATLLALVAGVLLRPVSPGLLVGAGAALGSQLFELAAGLWLMRASPRFVGALLFAPVFLVFRAGVDALAALGFRRHVWARTARRPAAVPPPKDPPA